MTKESLMESVELVYSETQSQDGSDDQATIASERKGQLEKQSELCYIDSHRLWKSREHVCDNCNKRVRGVYYKCSQCADYDLCDTCVTNSTAIHPDHSFNSVDLWSLMQQLRVEDPSELPSDSILVVPRVCCATCLNHHPENLVVPDQPYESKNKDGKLNGWMSTHTIFMSDLRTSSTRGCHLCSIIYRGLSSAPPSMASEDSRVQMVIKREHFRVAELSTVNFNRDMWNFYFRAGPGVQPPWHTLGQAHRYSDNFRSDSCFQKIQDWTSACEQGHDHPECTRGASVALPRRVLSISANMKDTTSPSVVLLETNGQVGKYIALSHCWGKTPITTTTSSNIGQMYQEVDIGGLPQTFKDAIYCAQKLDVKYLWIDSLCIVQDDIVDWEVESSKMAAIYADAYLVLAAGSADGDTKGFLKKRPKMYQGIPLESVEGSGVYEIVVNHIMPHPKVSQAGLKSLMLDSTIKTRAWCMQETVLARRIVYFYASEMVWECNSALTCECGSASSRGMGSMRVRRWSSNKKQGRGGVSVSGLNRTDIAGDYPTFRAKEIGFSFFNPSEQYEYVSRPFEDFTSAEAIYAEWRLMIVPLYTQKHLTKMTDRLPALSGLATRVTDHFPGEYVAGLWRHDMQLSLLWWVNDAEKPAPSTYLGPSFSWVSVDSPVVYPLPHRQNEFGGPMFGNLTVEFLDAKTSIVGSNPFGTVNEGHLRLKGLTHSLTLTLEGGKSNLTADCAYHELAWKFDTPIAEVHVLVDGEKPVAAINRALKQVDSEHRSQVNVTCLLVIDRPHVDGTMIDQSHDEYALLMLGPLKTRPEAHQRLGLAFISLDPEISKDWLRNAQMRELLIV